MRVRTAALESLERLDRRSATDAARARLSDPEPSVRVAALQVLARSAVTPDEAMLEDADPAVRALAAAMLLGHRRQAERVLDDVARASDAGTRAAALRAIAAARNPRAHSVALDRLSDPEAAVRAEAALALSAVAPDQAVEPLVAALADRDARVRDAAAEALAQIGRPAVDAVADALFDSRKDSALAALERLPLDGAAPRLRRFASESVARAVEDTRLRDALGTTDESALELLRDSLGARAERHAVDALRAAALLGDRCAVATALDSLTVADPAHGRTRSS
jgi:HEAT repeat protein